jgi:hypothetical protein
MKENVWAGWTAPIFVIRFALITPTVFYWTYGEEHYTIVSRDVEFFNDTYDTAIVTSERLAAKWGFILFLYNMVILLPSIIFIPPMNILLAIVDTAFTVFVSITTHSQTAYIPYSLDKCRDPVGLELSRPPGTNESFFAAAGRLNETIASPTKMCWDFVKERQYGTALS